MVSIFSLYKGREPRGHRTERRTFPGAENLSTIVNRTTARRRFDVYAIPIICQLSPPDEYHFHSTRSRHRIPGEGKEHILATIALSAIRSFAFHFPRLTKFPFSLPLYSFGPITNHLTNIPLFSASIHIQPFLPDLVILPSVAIRGIFGCVIAIGLSRTPVFVDRNQPTHSFGTALT